MKYVKKPVEVEAFRFDGTITNKHPEWAVDAYKRGVLVRTHTDQVSVRTLEGWLTAKVGDYIIRGIKGELYPCRADIFKETYVRVLEPVFGYCPYCGKEMESER